MKFKAIYYSFHFMTSCTSTILLTSVIKEETIVGIKFSDHMKTKCKQLLYDYTDRVISWSDKLICKDRKEELKTNKLVIHIMRRTGDLAKKQIPRGNTLHSLHLCYWFSPFAWGFSNKRAKRRMKSLRFLNSYVTLEVGRRNLVAFFT